LRVCPVAPALFRQQNAYIGVGSEPLTERRQDAMVGHAGHHDGIDAVLRANRVLILSLLWAALAACVVSSLVYDVAHWIHAL
jgi:hypothetical protein